MYADAAGQWDTPVPIRHVVIYTYVDEPGPASERITSKTIDRRELSLSSTRTLEISNKNGASRRAKGRKKGGKG